MNRRDFIKTSLVAGTFVVGATALAASQNQALDVTQGSGTQATVTDPFAAQSVTLNVNGKDYQVSIEPRDMLVNVLREDLGLIGTKRACNRMECGSCSILIDGVPYNSCQFIALRAVGHQILTTEGGVASTTKGAPAPDPVVQALHSAFVQNDGGQCGFCSPGQIMTAAALLKENPNPTVDEIKAAVAGNLCRCGNYPNIIASIQLAAQNLGGA